MRYKAYFLSLIAMIVSTSIAAQSNTPAAYYIIKWLPQDFVLFNKADGNRILHIGDTVRSPHSLGGRGSCHQCIKLKPFTAQGEPKPLERISIPLDNNKHLSKENNSRGVKSKSAEEMDTDNRELQIEMVDTLYMHPTKRAHDGRYEIRWRTSDSSGSAIIQRQDDVAVAASLFGDTYGNVVFDVYINAGSEAGWVPIYTDVKAFVENRRFVWFP